MHAPSRTLIEVGEFAVNPDIGLWQTNAVLNGRNSFYVTDEVEGTLSIKTILRGEGHWVTPRARYRVEPGSYLVLNQGQRYSVDIRSEELVETFCVFFKPGFADAVRARQLLDERPESKNAAEFYERLSPADDLVSPQLAALHTIIRRGESSELEANEAMMRVAEALLKNQTSATTQRDNLDIAKSATREEIFRRLNIARDYMIANIDKKADLHEIANVAMLSPFHFHRLFRSAYSQTPHEFLCGIRLSKARRLLIRTNLTMTEIAWRIGFESPAAFTKFFARYAGSPPSSFRATNAKR